MLRGVLGGLRLWYRLSGLEASRGHRFNIRARLNPIQAVIDGVEFDPRDLLIYVRRLANAIIEAGQRFGSTSVDRGKYHAKTKRRLTPQEESTLPPKKQRELIEVRPGARGHDVHAAVLQDPKANPSIQSIVRYLDEGASYSHDVRRKQGGRWVTDEATGQRIALGGSPENQLVLMHDPKSDRLRALRYPELVEKIGGSDPRRQRLIAVGALARLGGSTPAGKSANVADELATWIVHAEARRNPAAFVTSALALDAVASEAAEGRRPLELPSVLEKLPMSDPGAQRHSRELDEVLTNPQKSLDGAPAGARLLAEREIAMIKLWVEQLGMLTDDDKSAQDVQKRLEARIRNRMFEIYALTAQERSYVMAKLGTA